MCGNQQSIAYQVEAGELLPAASRLNKVLPHREWIKKNKTKQTQKKVKAQEMHIHACTHTYAKQNSKSAKEKHNLQKNRQIRFFKCPNNTL